MFGAKNADRLVSKLDKLCEKVNDTTMKRWINIASSNSLISVDNICKIISTESTTCGASPVTTYKIEFYGNGSITYPHTIATFNDVHRRNLVDSELFQWLCIDSSDVRVFNLCDTLV